MARKKAVKKSEAFEKQNLTILVLLIISFIILVSLYFLLGISEYANKTEIAQVTIGNNVIDAEVARSLSELRTGLMGRESLDWNNGMLFVFSEESELSFWMKDTLIPLDMIFINGDREIVKIYENVQPCLEGICQSYKSEVPARFVLEVNSGYVSEKGIKLGDVVEFE